MGSLINVLMRYHIKEQVRALQQESAIQYRRLSMSHRENDRDQRIKEAQEQRKAEHDELITEMRDLRTDIKRLIGTMEALTTAVDKKEWTVNSDG